MIRPEVLKLLRTLDDGAMLLYRIKKTQQWTRGGNKFFGQAAIAEIVQRGFIEKIDDDDYREIWNISLDGRRYVARLNDAKLDQAE